jgi:amino acid permease
MHMQGDFVPELVCEDGCNTPLQQFFGTRTVTVIIVAIVFLFPLAYQRDLSNLRFSSGLSMLCIVYAALMIGIRAIVGPRADSSELNVRGGGTGIFISFPITTVASEGRSNRATRCASTP